MKRGYLSTIDLEFREYDESPLFLYLRNVVKAPKTASNLTTLSLGALSCSTSKLKFPRLLKHLTALISMKINLTGLNFTEDFLSGFLGAVKEDDFKRKDQINLEFAEFMYNTNSINVIETHLQYTLAHILGKFKTGKTRTAPSYSYVEADRCHHYHFVVAEKVCRQRPEYVHAIGPYFNMIKLNYISFATKLNVNFMAYPFIEKDEYFLI